MSQIYILESWEEISPLGSWTLSAARERSVDGPSPPPASTGPCGLTACLITGEHQASQPA